MPETIRHSVPGTFAGREETLLALVLGEVNSPSRSRSDRCTTSRCGFQVGGSVDRGDDPAVGVEDPRPPRRALRHRAQRAAQEVRERLRRPTR